MKEVIVYKRVDELKGNPKNPRKNDGAVDTVAKSIETYGFKNPLIIDEEGIVWCGNTRLKAAKKLGIDEVPCIVVNDLTPKQMEEYALLDNKTNEIAEWDFDLLSEILPDLDLDDFGIDWGLTEEKEEEKHEEENPYTMKVDIPQYQITGECPKLKECINEDKVAELIKEIQNADITDEQKAFLINSAYRHLVFDYSKIAEYYAHQDKIMQELMEKSALVIIDFNDAIKNGYVEIRKEIEDIVGEIDEE